MLLTFYIYIFILGLLFGSFATVLITRWHEHEDGIVFGRSKCPKCHHTLSWFELFPLLSYLGLLGRCRKCHARIPSFYPLAEGVMGFIFLLLTYSYIRNFGFEMSPTYVLLLILGFITGVYVLADIRYMEIPDEIMVPGIYGYVALLLLGYLSEDISLLFFDRGTYIDSYTSFLKDHFLAALILYSFFYLQILIPAAIQLGKKERWKEIGEVGLSYFTFPYYLLFPPKDDKKDEGNEEALETWIGGGDLRIAIFIGLTLGIYHGIFAFFIAYIVGSFFGIVILIFQGKKKSQVPFGPFLALGWCSALYYHSEILIMLEFYKSLF
ncbi:prepilin peptidase [Candidatus Gracilibacteria bacterium]|nr:prepilin peptidase [Candidatus Gracilibacteria bacterium]